MLARSRVGFQDAARYLRRPKKNASGKIDTES